MCKNCGFPCLRGQGKPARTKHVLLFSKLTKVEKTVEGNINSIHRTEWQNENRLHRRRRSFCYSVNPCFLCGRRTQRRSPVCSPIPARRKTFDTYTHSKICCCLLSHVRHIRPQKTSIGTQWPWSGMWINVPSSLRTNPSYFLNIAPWNTGTGGLWPQWMLHAHYCVPRMYECRHVFFLFENSHTHNMSCAYGVAIENLQRRPTVEMEMLYGIVWKTRTSNVNIRRLKYQRLIMVCLYREIFDFL